ncbi:MAG TPA: ABC transporter permease [Tepidisphaeraceae bacterium]|jgi:oligopeptide transport system permease protein|nr:ABC transporter permease [Tepidisphaeraceae bacterium]
MTVVAMPEAMQANGPADVDHPLRRALRSGRVVVGGSILGLIVLVCVGTMPMTLGQTQLYYDLQNQNVVRMPPAWTPFTMVFGTDGLGRSLLARCLLGGVISLAVGFAAAGISLVLGVSVGLVAGYRGGWVDSVLMRVVDILYGLPYILLVILFKIALEPVLGGHMSAQAANMVVLFSAIGLVSWLTMARVVRGQVLSLRGQPFVEACRAVGLSEPRIFLRHILPNLIGPVIVYATLTVPNAILQESFLSFLGMGIVDPLPSWGKLAGDGLLTALNPLNPRWWMLLFPCLLLVVTLLSLNFLGDGLRDVFDPKRDAAKI